MISVILWIAFCAFIYWLCMYFGMTQPWLKIALVFLVIVAIIIVLNYFGVNTGISLR